MEDGSISDGQISASSERKEYFGPANARLNLSGDDTRVAAWMPGRNDPNQWLQVDFGNETKVTGIDTQGRRCRSCHQWVKEYAVSYSRDNVTFRKYKKDGNVKVFFDNFSISTIQDIQGHLGPTSCASCVCVCVFFFCLQIKGIPGEHGPRLHRPSRVESSRFGAVHPHKSYKLEPLHRHEGGVPGL